jgi:rubrerythrin
MKIRWMILMGIALATAFFLVGRASADKSAGLAQKTQENLSTAMHGEAFAYAKYLLYAEKARKSGNVELADLLERTAKTERFEHFAEEAKLAGLAGSNAANLKDAIKGESYEVETMYREFAEQATAAGDKLAAERFQEIRKDEMKHRDAFQAALAKVEPKAAGGQ